MADKAIEILARQFCKADIRIGDTDECSDGCIHPAQGSICAFRQEALEALEKLNAQGYVVVPRRPTSAMLDAAADMIVPSKYLYANGADCAWRLMAAAALGVDVDDY